MNVWITISRVPGGCSEPHIIQITIGRVDALTPEDTDNYRKWYDRPTLYSRSPVSVG